MTHSYFKEPGGIFRTMKGFLMGDSSAARGSKIILCISKLTIYSKLSMGSMNPNMSSYLRFRDDLSLHIIGHPDAFLRCVRIICTWYPDCMVFNMETRVIYGKFLNICIYNDPTSVLQKPSNKYNITPPQF